VRLTTARSKTAKARVALLVIAILSTLLVVAEQPRAASAITGSEFDPGFIITDEVFYDGDSMSEASIQAFLERMEPECAGANGYTCLARYTTPTFNRDAVGANHCGAYAGAASERASAIIAKVALTCGINPKVLLVMLQKEQGLVTKSSPTSFNYRSAMGYGCPDTAPCDAQFYGFFNQVYKAAWQMRQYSIGASTRAYHIGAVAVRFNPNVACGQSVINIRNQATANLYLYTPYQPNAAAMANLRGTGDGCSSYGNRNFWVYFNDWFGATGTIGYVAIDQAYARWGGVSGVLGAVVGSPNPIAENGGGLVQGFQNGAIAWSQSRGAFAVMGDIRAYFGGLGGVGGVLGWPASDPVAVAAGGGGTVQSFAGGAVAASPAGVFSLVGSVRSFFSTVGGIGGALGWPSGDRSCSPAGVCTQSFAGGVAYVQPSGSGQYLLPAFDAAYVAAGGPSGPLGWPATGPIRFAASGGGTVQGFAGGALAGADGAAAHTLAGVMRSAYNSAGGVNSELGWPAGESSCTAGVCTQQYQNGTIFWSAQYGARASVGAVAVAYAALGATSSALGWPVTGMLSVAGGRVQGFERGAIASSAAGAFALSGPTRDYYNTVGGLGGPLGWPAGALSCTAGTCTQQFAAGTLYWSAATGGRYSTGPIAAAYNAQGGPAGPAGWPVTGMLAFTANGGGTVQGFQGAAFASSAAGAYSLSGAVRDFYNTTGGITGPLGWPTGAMTCTGAVCTQPFTGGTISYDPATGATLI
jgi:uncharacterized protein with LGFP repeats